MQRKRIGAYLVEWAKSQKAHRGWQWTVTDEDDDVATGHSCHDDATAVACAEAVVRVLEDARKKRISLAAADVRAELQQKGIA